MASPAGKKTSSAQIIRAARAHGLKMTEAAVLGYLLFAWQQTGGINRFDKRWIYHNANSIAEATALTTRTVERSLARLYGTGVLDRFIGHRPNGGQTVSYIRPLEPALSILDAAAEIVLSKRNVPLVPAILAVPDNAKGADGITQSGGSNIQTDLQKEQQTDLQKNVSVQAGDDPVGDPPETQEEESGEEEAEWISITKSELKNSEKVKEGLDCLCNEAEIRGMPKTLLKSADDAEMLLQFVALVESTGWEFRDLVGSVFDNWPDILKKLPAKFQQYEGNIKRPTIRALRWKGPFIITEAGYCMAKRSFQVALEAQLSGMPDDLKGMVGDVAHELSKLARTYLVGLSRRLVATEIGGFLNQPQ